VKSNTDTDFQYSLDFEISIIKKITANEGILFADLSGDYNPIHINSSYSLSSLFGKKIIHGCNITFECLKILDSLLENTINIKNIKSIFHKPLFYDNDITFKINKNEFKINIVVLQDNIEKATIYIENNIYLTPTNFVLKNSIHTFKTEPDNTTINTITNGKYAMELNYGCKHFQFNNINNIIQIYIFAITRFVGMKIPGLNSILYSFEFNINDFNKEKYLNFTINNIDKRFNKVDLSINSNNINGNIVTFYRPVEVKQLDFSKVHKFIKDNNYTNTYFEDKNVIIIGGSSGLGNILYKILISFGVKNINVSYYKNSEEIMADSKKFNNLSCFKLNLKQDIIDDNLLKTANVIFYFATPRIEGNENKFDNTLFSDYNEIYVEKFYNLIITLKQLGNNKVKVFFPSTEAIETQPLIWKEYYLSKINAENIAQTLINTTNIDIKFNRLPKLLTNQTNSVSFNDQKELYINVEYLVNLLNNNYCKNNNLKIYEDNQIKNENNLKININTESKNVNNPKIYQNKISILSSINIDTIKDKLSKKISKFIDDIGIHTYEYGQLQQNFMFEDSELYKQNPEFIFIIDRPEDIINKSLDEYEDNDSEKIITYFNSIKSYVKANPNVTIFIMEYFLTEKSINFNCISNNILNIFQENLNLLKDEYKLNINIMKVQNIKDGEILDKRMWYIGKIPYTDKFINKLASKITGLILSMKGLTARLLVLDLDNTLWGGVVGEDGVHGIKIGEDYPGNIFKEFQKKIKLLKERGIALAICSKNDINIVNEVFEKNKNMILKKEDFVYIYANWDNKFENIKLISDNIGLGLKNILFIDDNPVEREQVKEFLPDVNVLELSKDPVDYIDNLLNSPLLEIHKLTESDKKRAKTYETKVKLDNLEKKYVNKEDFYKQLDLEIFVNKLSSDNKDRCVQLINKTNQFNATSLRLKESDLLKYKIYVLGAKDKFNDYENMGILITTELDNIIEINNYLMSCRFLGKDLENEFIKWLLNYAKNNNFNKVTGKIIETERNEPIRNIYKNNNFILKDDLFVYNLDNLNIEMKEYIKLHDNTNNEIELNLESTNQNLGVKNDNYVDLNKINNKILNVIKSIIDDDAIKIFDELIKNNKLYDNINYIPSWSSLKHIILINKLEETFKIKISIDQIIKIKTISDLNKLIEKI
jgi:FkbH-like protein